MLYKKKYMKKAYFCVIFSFGYVGYTCKYLLYFINILFCFYQHYDYGQATLRCIKHVVVICGSKSGLLLGLWKMHHVKENSKEIISHGF